MLPQLACCRILRQAADEELVGARDGALDVYMPSTELVLLSECGGDRGSISEGHITEATGAAVRPTQHHRIDDHTEAREVIPEILRRRLVRQASDEDLPWVALFLEHGTVQTSLRSAGRALL
eukprot:CAMPEP_0170607620 /NCGR_PEP_ID=MMETSP0224-20130122/21150_1 /TAXON_ID=285029 /ORGANISM="Togula jolla, Strain CCCM 725" /LENGTH=121 /DNA_ID=CAMNT_0010932795 /DNA_START=1276 /DNA_END=1637 /DNA_ORIENTATION=+